MNWAQTWLLCLVLVNAQLTKMKKDLDLKFATKTIKKV